jgi:nicotinate-nucleotide pyrophosphorylase (carboxylating)
MPSLPPLDPSVYRDVVRRALEEDLGAGDVTSMTTVDADRRAVGVFLVKAGCVLAGVDIALDTFRQLDPSIEVRLHAHDGDWCEAGEEVAEVAGPARTLLAGERTALNFLQRLSGIATRTREFVEATGGRLAILDTRKTTPTLRALEKYAVRVGGGRNHRFGLFDAVLIKDNHVRMAGGVGEAVRRAVAAGIARIIVEVDRIDQIEPALAAGATHLLLDNMEPATLRGAVTLVGGRVPTEASGGVRLETIREIAATGVTYVSVGRLTQSAPAVDIGLDFSAV